MFNDERVRKQRYLYLCVRRQLYDPPASFIVVMFVK